MSSTISGLTAGTAPDGTELVEVVQGGNSRRLTAQEIAETATRVADVASGVLLGRTTAGAGYSEELGAATVRSFLNVADGATNGATWGTNLSGIPNNVSSLAGLSGAANRLPYFTGAGAMGLTGLTPKARTLLDSADLEISGGEFKIGVPLGGTGVTQSDDDTTGDRVAKVGWLGHGETGFLEIASDIDDQTVPNGLVRRWASGGTSGDIPNGFGNGIFVTYRRSTSDLYQVAFPRNADTVLFRECVGGTWGSWRTFWHTGNTTVGGGGELLEASPIIRLYNDNTEEPNKPVGATMQRLSTGHYALTGCPPLRQSGWRTKPATGVDGEVLATIETAWVGDTLHVLSYVDGVPGDIPDGAFALLRFWEPAEEGDEPPAVEAMTAEAFEALLQERLASAVNAERNRRLASGDLINVTGHGDVPVQGRPEDQVNLIALGDTAKDLIAQGVTDPVLTFRDAENVMRDLTPDQMAELVRKSKAQASAIYAAAWALKDSGDIPADYADDAHWP